MPLVRGHYAPINSEWLLAGKPTGLYRTNMPRLRVADAVAAQTSGVMLSVALPLQAGDVVTSLTFATAGTAAATLTHWWFALYAPDLSLLSQTDDQTSAVWAANTAKTLALGDPQLVDESGVYYAAVMVAATTMPTMVGATIQAGASGGLLADDVVLAQTSGSAITDTAPATITSATASGSVPLVIAT